MHACVHMAAMLTCLRFFRILPPINEVEEKKNLFSALQERIATSQQVVKDLKFDLSLCCGFIKDKTSEWRKTRSPILYEELRSMYTQRRQIEEALQKALEAEGEHVMTYRQTRINLAQMDEAKKASEINKLLKRLDVNIDKLADDVKETGDLLSDHQRAADSTRPYSGGMAVTSLADDDFKAMLAAECQQIELEQVNHLLHKAPPVPNGNHNGAVEVQILSDDVQQDIRSFLVQEEADEEDGLGFIQGHPSFTSSYTKLST